MDSLPKQFRQELGDGIININNKYYFTEEYAKELIKLNPKLKQFVDEYTYKSNHIGLDIKLPEEFIEKYEEEKREYEKKTQIKTKKKKRQYTGYIPRNEFFPSNKYYNRSKKIFDKFD